MRILVTAQFEYETDPANYPEDYTPTQMAEKDFKVGPRSSEVNIHAIEVPVTGATE